MTVSLGIDAATGTTGIVVLEANGKNPNLLLEESFSPPDKVRGILRKNLIAARVMEAIVGHHPDRIVIEGYSLNLKNASSVIPLVELGGLLRFCMWLDDHHWFEPTATELKKFVVGRGNNVKKEQVMMYVLHRWGHVSKDNNTADAYGLACMGLAHAGKLAGITVEQRSVIGKMRERNS